jgi:hypothetical protein
MLIGSASERVAELLSFLGSCFAELATEIVLLAG